MCGTHTGMFFKGSKTVSFWWFGEHSASAAWTFWIFYKNIKTFQIIKRRWSNISFNLVFSFGGSEESWKTFEQVNTSTYTTHTTYLWLLQKIFKILDSPNLSPGINPIENVYCILTRQIYNYGKQCDSLEKFNEAVEKAWRDATRVVS